MLAEKIAGKPCAGKLHARFDEGELCFILKRRIGHTP
jgi:hypothetical protein